MLHVPAVANWSGQDVVDVADEGSRRHGMLELGGGDGRGGHGGGSATRSELGGGDGRDARSGRRSAFALVLGRETNRGER